MQLINKGIIALTRPIGPIACFSPTSLIQWMNQLVLFKFVFIRIVVCKSMT
jgi:hypothetical protein